jgi:hypothetical protein
MNGLGSSEGNGWIDFSDLSRAHAHKGCEGRKSREEEEGMQGERKEGGETMGDGPKTSQAVFESVPIPLLLRTQEFIEQWADWVEYRLECGRFYGCPATYRCFRQSMRKCERWGLQRSILAIEHSIEAGYRGLYEPLYPRDLKKEPNEPKITPRL